MTWTAKRAGLLRELRSEVDPPPVVAELLDAPIEQLLVPTRQARDLHGWLGRLHAYHGTALPKMLVDMRASNARRLNSLEAHPGMFGHGTHGHQRSMPIACWRVPNPVKWGRLFTTVDDSGEEGFLLQEPGYWVERVRISSWDFEPMAHGPVRTFAGMHLSVFSFEHRRRIEREALQATTQNTAAAIRTALQEQGPEAPLGQD